MFEKDIKFISDFCINQVRQLGTTFTFEKLAAIDLHPAILKYISAELDFMIYADRRKLLQNSYFDYSGKEISLYFKKMAEEVKKTKRISLEDMQKLIIQAVSFNANFVVRPKWSLTKLIYNEEKTIPVEELSMMLNYIYYYDYIPNVLATYLAKRKVVLLNLTEFDLILNKIDRELFKVNTEKLIENALISIGDFFNIGGVIKSRVSPAAVEVLLKEKNLTDHLLRLRRAIPETAKKNYEISDIKSVLFATTPVLPNSIQGFEEERKPVEKSVNPVDNKKEESSADEDKEGETEEEIGPHIESLADEVISNTELELTDDKISGGKITEIDKELEKDFEEISRLEQQLERERSDSSFEEFLSQEIEDKTSEETYTPAEDVPFESEPEKENDEFASADIDSGEIKEDELNTEKEIVSEMLKDHFGEEPDEDQIEKFEKYETELLEKQSEVESAEFIDDTLPENEITETKIIPEPRADEIKEPELNEPVKTPEEELMDMFEDLEIIERGKTDFSDVKPEEPVQQEPAAMQSEEEIEMLSVLDDIAQDLKTFDEFTFQEPDFTASVKKEELKSEPEHTTETPASNFVQEETVKPEVREKKPVVPSPRSLRKKDLLTYLKGKEVKKIISNVFGGDEVDFVTTTEKIMECGAYREATDIIKGVFLSYKINPYSKEALVLTNAVSNYFRQA